MHHDRQAQHDHDLGLAHDLVRLQQQALARRTALRWLMGAGAMNLVGCGGGGDATSSESSSGSSGSSSGSGSSAAPHSLAPP
jgi:hypothetical protein